MAGFSASTFGAVIGLIKATLAGNGAIQGNPGRTPELRANDTHIQWRFIGESTWYDLIALSVLEGTDGDDGDDGDDGLTPELRISDRTLQWKYTIEAATAWRDLYTFPDVSGKLDKVTGANPSGLQRLYAVDAAGNQKMLDVVTDKVPGSVPAYDSNGSIKVGAPSKNDDAANKYYVDQAIKKALEGIGTGGGDNGGDGENQITGATFYGSVYTDAPGDSDIQSMNRRDGTFANFIANLGVISNARSCLASPMANPITDIRDTVFGLSVLSTFFSIDNVMVSLESGIVAYKVWVKTTNEDSFGQDLNLDIRFGG